MDKNKDKDEEKEETKSPSSYPMRGLALFGRSIFTAFLVWCTFNYPMSEDMRTWFFIWAVATWIVS